MDTLEILMQARGSVVQGWHQGGPGCSPNGVCAIWAVLNVTQQNTPALAALQANLPYGWSIISFNDNPETTKADVLALFDRAINAEAQKAVPVADPAHTYTVTA